MKQDLFAGYNNKYQPYHPELHKTHSFVEYTEVLLLLTVTVNFNNKVMVKEKFLLPQSTHPLIPL